MIESPTFNLGIGTTGPAALLDVQGAATIYVNGSSGVSPVVAWFTNGTANERGRIYNDAGTDFYMRASANNQGNLQFQTITGGSATTRVYVKNDGNVGIGTTSPGAPLNVYQNATISNPILKVQNAGTGGYAILSIDRASNLRVAATSYTLSGTDEWYTGELYNGGSATTGYSIGTSNTLDSTTKLTITTAGNVGIGTTGPNVKLDVVGRVDVGHSAGYGLINWNAADVNNSSYMYLGMSDEAGWFKIGTNKNGTGTYRSIAFIPSSNGSEAVSSAAMVIATSSNVGIFL